MTMATEEGRGTSLCLCPGPQNRRHRVQHDEQMIAKLSTVQRCSHLAQRTILAGDRRAPKVAVLRCSRTFNFSSTSISQAAVWRQPCQLEGLNFSMTTR